MPCAQPRRRRRGGGGPGWLYAMLPPNAVWPVRAHGALIQAALLAALRGVLGTGRAGRCCAAPNRTARCAVFPGAARRAPAPPLYGGGWRRNAAAWPCSAQGAVFTAAARLPLCGGVPAAAPDAREALCDRYSLLYQFLGEWAALP